MDGAEKRLKNRELLLLVAEAAGGTLGGKTIAQKLFYFAGVALHQPTGHSAYFYGPYSDQLDAALNRSLLADELYVTIERIPDWHGREDALKHIFTLTKKGKAEVEEIAAAHTEDAERVRATVASIAEAIPRFHQSTLSAAAKIHLIVSEQNRSTTPTELKQLAKGLGWSLKSSEVTKAINVLSELKLVKVG